MPDGLEGAAELKRQAWRERERGAPNAARAHLGQAIEELEVVLREHRAGRSGEPDAKEVALAAELADLYGTLGGTLHKEGKELEAAVAYDAGYGYEADERYRLPSTYNALNRLIARIFLEPAALTDSDALRRHEGLPVVDVPHDLEAVRARLEREAAGPRANDWWAAGDIALASALIGDAANVASALAHFAELDPAPSARLAYRDVADGLAALDTPRRRQLAQLSSSFADEKI